MSIWLQKSASIQPRTSPPRFGCTCHEFCKTTNTPDLDVSPATDIKTGWFWIVTVAGNFFSEAVQPGDMIYANQDNPGAVYANWTVIHTGGPAGSGATDGATAKGTAGFDSAGFDVTASPEIVLSAKKGITAGLEKSKETSEEKLAQLNGSILAKVTDF